MARRTPARIEPEGHEPVGSDEDAPAAPKPVNAPPHPSPSAPAAAGPPLGAPPAGPRRRGAPALEQLGMGPGTARLVRFGIAAWALIGLATTAWALFMFVLHPIDIVFPPLFVALVIVYLLNPIVSALQRRGVGRVWGSLLTYVVFFTAVGLIVRALIPQVSRQVSDFVASVPTLLSRLQGALGGLASRFGADIDTRSIVETIGPGGGAGAFIERVFGFTTGVIHLALAIVLGAVLAFYLLVDLPKIQRALSRIVPARRLPEVRTILDDMGRALGGYFRGQLLVALFVGLTSMLGLWIVGLPYWAVVGSVAGLFNLIPLLGPFIGAVPALFIAFTTGESGGLLALEPGWPLALGAGLALLAVQQIDNHVLSPNIVARTVQLHPVTVMLGLLAAGTVAGIPGMLLVVPVIASVKILLLHYWDTRMEWPPRGERAGAAEGRPAAMDPDAPEEREAADASSTREAAPARQGRSDAGVGG